jgi:type I restriction enzyme M protein
MLDQETKRKIDACRDVLVGKIPDPKAQVEQITTALIYKFMDDMDKESIGLGGKPRFFTGEFSQYAWNKLMDTKLGGQGRLNLYAEAIEKMNQNKNIPQLFRDIFKDAFLPYRDPETLNLFLKEIHWFNYDHSEKLGDAFEYLLSILGSQGDAGQFRTPRHIIDFIVKVLDPKKDESVLDPACGTAGFLIFSYKHILEQNKEKNLTPDEKKKLMSNFQGYDISPDMVRLSLVNLYLHSFPLPSIHEYDTLTSEEHWDDSFDVILANPPFMTPKGGIRPHKRFSIQANRSEVLFVDYIAEHLNLHGRAGVIVPEGIIFQSANAYKALRKMLIENNLLYAVVSLPQGVFNPYSGVKTSILLMDKVLAKKAQDILFIKIENDGFDLGAQRRPVDHSDLPQVLDIIKQYQLSLKQEFVIASEAKQSRSKSSAPDKTEIATVAALPRNDKWLLVPKAKILSSSDFNLSADRYRETITLKNQKWQLVELGEVVEILDSKRVPINKSERKPGPFPYYGATGIVDYVDNYLFDERLVLIGEDGAKWDSGDKTAFIVEGRYWVNNHAHVLRPIKNKLIDVFLVEVINHIDLSQYITGVTVPKLNQEKLRSIKIPLPPLEVQQEIVNELDGYQKIIDAARQILSSYKPTIPINPDWEMVELKTICENLDSQRRPVEKSIRVSGKYPYYGASGIVDSVEDFIFDGDFLLVSEDGANLRARVTPIAFSVSGKVWVNNHAHILKFANMDTQKLVELYLNSICLDNYITGTAQPKLNQDKLNSILVPLPPLETQKEIVSRIEEEQKLMDGNKKLIELYEQKIKKKISEVWGE